MVYHKIMVISHSDMIYMAPFFFRGKVNLFVFLKILDSLDVLFSQKSVLFTMLHWLTQYKNSLFGTLNSKKIFGHLFFLLY